MISLLSDDEKENLNAINIETQPEPGNTTSLVSLAIEQQNNSFPSTPAGRLALPDLICMGDVQRVVQEISPEDRIEWDLRSSSSQLGVRRAKKRARSSSPLSSPGVQVSAHFNSKGESVDTQIDSGLELWGRYSLNGSNLPTPQAATLPAIANMMLTSSPQNSRGNTPRSGMFRRTSSCGTSFPKRRRIGCSQKDDVFTESANIGPSKLSVLIERVQEGLARPAPTPKKQRLNHKADGIHRPCRSNSTSPIQQEHNDTAIPTPQTTHELKKNQKSQGSDYGDFDDDDVEEASLLTCFPSKQNRSLICDPIPSKSSSRPKPYSQGPVNESCHADKQHPPGVCQRKESIPTQGNPRDDNEFDDSDEDLFAAGLDDMVASFSNNTQPVNAQDDSKQLLDKSLPIKSSLVVDDSDDEFGGGDLDIVDFQVAELAATQSIRQSSNSVLPVRTRDP